jgi:hypothetical protein
MKKIMLLLMIAFVWWHKAASQSHTGLEQYYYMDSKTITVSPKAWYQSKKGWYVEGRYNYEAAKTMSVCAGKSFERKAAFSYSITPLAGIVTGKLNGGALAENATIKYKKFLFSLQSQYTFSVEDPACSYVYGWADLSYPVFHGISAGVSVQQTKLYGKNGKSEKGFFLKAEFGKWEFPVYVFNVKGNERYIMLGLNYTYR